jgi:hypothetical protein
MENLALKLNRHFYIVVFLASAVFYYLLLFVFNVQTDIQKHVDFAIEMVHGSNLPATFLYFAAVCVVGLFRDDYNSLLLASAIVLSLATAYKFFLTARVFAAEIEDNSDLSKNKIYLLSNIIGVCLITAFCIYLPKELGLTQYFFLGQIPPNVWHNSTTIFLMPFAILLYWRSYQLLENFEMKKLWWVVGLVIINILAKPNFFLCFVVVFPLMALIRFRLKKEFFLCLIPPALGGVLLILQYIAIYQLGTYGYGKPEESSVILAPFVWWKLFAENIPVSILLSAAFPLVYLVFYIKRVQNQPFLYYAYLLFAVGVALLALLGETGPRAGHGNFQWQAIVSNYILFFAVALDFSKNALQRKELNLKDKIIAIVFLLHFFSGLIYLAKTLLRGNYG